MRPGPIRNRTSHGDEVVLVSDHDIRQVVVVEDELERATVVLHVDPVRNHRLVERGELQVDRIPAGDRVLLARQLLPVLRADVIEGMSRV